MSDAAVGSDCRSGAEAAHIEVIAAGREQQGLIDDMMQLYVLDFAEFVPLERTSTGRFVYDLLPLYWTEPSRHPFLVKANGSVAGFALVKGEFANGGGKLWDMAEFFIFQAHRRRGFGTAAAHCLWTQLSGEWQIRVMESNCAACSFWERAIARLVRNRFAVRTVESGGRLWRVFKFKSTGPESVEDKQLDSQ